MANGGARPGAGRKVANHTLEAAVLRQKLIEAYSLRAPEINKALIDKAITGDVPAIKELHDRVHGKAMQAIEMTGKDGKDLVPTPTMTALAAQLDEIRKKA